MRVAILDLNNNVANRGIGYLKQMTEQYGLPYEVFDVRYKNEIPDTGFDIYLSSGGPGSPFDMDGIWDIKYSALIDQLWKHNLQSPAGKKKYVFFICHSFQLACIHFKVGKVALRGAKSFGTFPAFKTKAGEGERYLQNLPNPFWIADFRDWQVTDADETDLQSKGFQIMAIERARKTPNAPRAIMAIRFSNEMFATQFHPEADADGMLHYFQQTEKRTQLIEEQGMEKYLQMIADLEDPQKIELTHRSILPAFMEDALKQVGKLV